MAHQKESEEFSHLLALWIELNEKIQQSIEHRIQIERRIGSILKLLSVVQEDRRIHLRIPCQIPASVRLPDQAQETRGEVKDIGMGGLFLQTETTILVGEELSITLFAQEQNPLTLSAQVAWRKTNEPKGIGVRWGDNSVPDESSLLKIIIDILKELYQKNGGLPLP